MRRLRCYSSQFGGGPGTYAPSARNAKRLRLKDEAKLNIESTEVVRLISTPFNGPPDKEGGAKKAIETAKAWTDAREKICCLNPNTDIAEGGDWLDKWTEVFGIYEKEEWEMHDTTKAFLRESSTAAFKGVQYEGR